MDFLGNVNVFHGRVEKGKAVVHGLEVAYPDYPHEEARDASVYVRPHEFTIDARKNGPESLEAKVLHVNPTGSRAKIELRIVESQKLINAELTAERFAELELKSGDTVYVSARKARVFMPSPPP
jgi:sulfate transport system ATP-binding protein